MNNWEETIKAKNLERALSIMFQLTDFSKAQEDELRKSIIDDHIEKSGLEIKEKLQLELSTIITDKESLVTKMSSLVKSVDSEPEVRVDSRLIKGFENQLENIPKQYSHTQIYSNSEKSTPMRKFNQLASDYISKSIEELKFKTTIDNLSDDRVVRLTKSLADQLGFSSEEIEKGGEGSRGGKIIGHTKSGKPVYEKLSDSRHDNFTKEDRQDALKHYSKRAHQEELDGKVVKKNEGMKFEEDKNAHKQKDYESNNPSQHRKDVERGFADAAEQRKHEPNYDKKK